MNFVEAYLADWRSAILGRVWVDLDKAARVRVGSMEAILQVQDRAERLTERERKNVCRIVLRKTR